MNKDKAIQLLERLQDPEPYEPMLTKDAYDAIQMAIDALSADGDTISREVAIDALDEIESEIADGYGYQYAKWREYFAEIPSAQPERIKGRWIEIALSNHTYKCSVCGRLLVNITDGKNNVAKNYPYCHCGADMGGGQNERDS